MRIALIVLCAALIAACGSSGASTTVAAPRAATTAQACPSGTSVTAPLDTILRVPSQRRGKRTALIVALHFASGDGAAMEQATGLTTEAKRSGFDVAYPTAPASNGFWAPTDLPKLQQTIAAIEQTACIDPRRVYLLGWSNGGGMAGLGACALADQVAAVALFAPAVHFAKTCNPARAVSVLEVHGTADPIVRYADGRSFITAWAKRDGCTTPPLTTRKARVSRLAWAGCRDGAAVAHLRLARGRHVQLFDDLRKAGTSPTATAWSFLSTHRLP